MYLFLASVAIEFTYIFKILSIRGAHFYRVCQIRAIRYSNVPHDKKVELLRKLA